MELNKIKDSLIHIDKQLSEDDWKEVEQKLYCTIPSCVKNFYNTVNGGLTIGNLFLLNGDEQITIKKFMPIKYNADFHNAPESTMEGMTLIQRSHQTIGSHELIIGITAGRPNRICVNVRTGVVELYPLIGLNKDAFIFDPPIFISSSFDQFLSMLKYEPKESDDNLIRKERTSKEKLKIETSAKKLSSEDWLEFEKNTKFKLPTTMKNFYLKNNGGMPNLNFFSPQDEDMDEVEINIFLPIKYPLKGIQTIEETSRSLWERNMISKSFLPFAIDSGNNLYAIHNKTLCIYYIVMDIWHNEWSCEENFKANSTKIASSFRYFITHLIPEE